MKIALVSAHYMPEVGYQEVHLAKAYARLGHLVKVFTSTAIVSLGGDINSITYKKGLTKDAKFGFEILRLPSLSFKSKVIPFGLKKTVIAFEPEVLIILGVAKIFPYSLFCKQISENCKIISIYGDADEYLDRKTLKQKIITFIHELGFKLIKQPLYKKAINHGDSLIMNIPETKEFFLKFLTGEIKSKFEKKCVMLNLGYDPEEYFFSKEERALTRKNLNVSEDEILIITSTRVNKRKNLESIVKQISEIKQAGQKVCYAIIGFLNDDYEKELKAFIQMQPDPSIFKCFPFVKAEEIRKLYSAADVGIWLKAAISIQEAMGTGLPVILENKPSVNHLIEDEKNGWFFSKATFGAVIKKSVDILSEKKINRELIASENAKKLSYDVVAQNIL